MTRDQFEQAYDALAAALDQVGDDAARAALLARLALVLAQQCDDLEAFEAALVVAMAPATPTGS